MVYDGLLHLDMHGEERTFCKLRGAVMLSRHFDNIKM